MDVVSAQLIKVVAFIERLIVERAVTPSGEHSRFFAARAPSDGVGRPSRSGRRRPSRLSLPVGADDHHHKALYPASVLTLAIKLATCGAGSATKRPVCLPLNLNWKCSQGLG